MPKKPPLKVGDAVRSKAIGAKPEFDGIISDVIGCIFKVRDENGNLWHRVLSELTLIQPKERVHRV